MTGKELIDYIQSNHLEECEIQVFSSEKWKWIPVLKPMHSGSNILLDAAYLTPEHVKQIKERQAKWLEERTNKELLN